MRVCAPLLGPLRGRNCCCLWFWQVGLVFHCGLPRQISPLPPNPLSNRDELHDGRKHMHARPSSFHNATVTVTPFRMLYHLVQGILQNTHVNRILLYARTSNTLLFSVRLSSFCRDFAWACLIDSLVFDQVEKDRYTNALRDKHVVQFLPFLTAADSELSIGCRADCSGWASNLAFQRHRKIAPSCHSHKD